MEDEGRERVLSVRDEQERQLDGRLRALAQAGSSRSAPLRVRQRLLAEVELHAAQSSRLRFASRPALRWGLATLSVVVALLLLAASELPLGFRSALPLENWKALLSTPGAAGSGYRPQSTGVDDSVLLSSANYVSLPYSDPSISNGTETTVRVDIPSSELLAWGVPSPESAPGEEVPAELLLGDDGLPRAVRVLPATSSSVAEEVYP